MSVVCKLKTFKETIAVKRVTKILCLSIKTLSLSSLLVPAGELFILSAKSLCIEPRFCQASEWVHPCDVGPTGSCHGYSVLTARELCRLVEDIINNKGLEAKVAWGSVWETSSHSYYNWHPPCLCVCVCACVDDTRKVWGRKNNRTLPLCCIYLLDKQFALNVCSWLVFQNVFWK